MFRKYSFGLKLPLLENLCSDTIFTKVIRPKVDGIFITAFDTITSTVVGNKADHILANLDSFKECGFENVNICHQQVPALANRRP